MKAFFFLVLLCTFSLQASPFKQMLDKHCVECHRPDEMKGDVDLTIFKDKQSFYVNYDLLINIYDEVESGSMPPEEDSKMTSTERKSVTDFLGSTIHKLGSTSTNQTGPTKIRRLTSYEYDSTVKAVTGLDLKLSKGFAADGAGGEGFYNDSAILGVSPLQFEQYLAAAEVISTHSNFDTIKGFSFSQKPSDPKTKKETLANIEEGSNRLLKELYPKDFSIKAYLPRLMLAVNEFFRNGRKKELLSGIYKKYNINKYFLARGINYFSSSYKKGIIERDFIRPWFELKTEKYDENKAKEVSREFTENYLASLEKIPEIKEIKRQPYITFINNIKEIFSFTDKELITLIDKDKINKFQNLKVTRDVIENGMRSKYRSSFARQIMPHIRSMMTKAYRKPPTEQEVVKMTKDFINTTSRFGVSVAAKLFIIRTFVHMKFIYRHEKKYGKNVKITDYELASRLSYFLWSTVPDKELVELASKKQLSKPDILKQQVKRMIKDKKSSALAKHFAAQWLQFDKIKTFDHISKEEYPEFTKDLAKDMWRESAICFEYIVKNDRSVLEIIDADYTFLNSRLRRHYGIGGGHSGFSKVMLRDKKRGGILGHASFLTVTSTPLRTSPVLRGNWILNNLLGTPVPPAPPNVEALPEEEVVSKALTLKEQLKNHRKSTQCRGCHQKIDPLGFTLEHYDVLGRWRDKYKKAPIDDNGELLSAKTIEGLSGLKKYINKNKDSYLKNMSRKLFSYALGRSVEYYDFYVINNMVKSLKEDDYRFSSMVFEVVNSYQFLHKN
ncbi:MAG: DUF1592 domain-containing protein [Lentisphaeraceae bacterium]|nr:DUF1592 domain-containing protein [Lentisphaeraceae bacterium]